MDFASSGGVGVTGNGRVALVTGAARGIGAATVHALAEQGWSVLAADVAADDPALPYPMGTAEQLSRAVADANRSTESSDRVRPFLADVRDQAALHAAVADAESYWGGLDAAIAAAGVIAGGVPQWEVPITEERAVLDIDLGGVLNLARAAVPALLRRPEPRSAICGPPATSPTRTGSMAGLEVIPIHSVTLGDGHDPGERALTRR